MRGRPDFDELGLHPLPRTPERAPDLIANLQNDAASVPSTPESAQTEARRRYLVTASARRTSSGTVPTLKVVRLTDKRVIYPFQGCADMPLFEEAADAKQFAENYGQTLVDGDIAVPEA